MPVLLLLAALAAVGLVWSLRGGDDVPTRIVTAAADRLPADRREWGRAMVAELTGITGRPQRWRFAAGVLRVALVPPPRHGSRVLAVAGVGLAVAAGATAATAVEVPSLSVSVGVLSVLLCGYATVVAARSPRPRITPPYLVAVAVTLAGVAAALGLVVRVAATHPTATADGTHVFAVLFGLALAGYVAAGFTAGRPGPVLWWAVAGALAGSAGWFALALTRPAEGVAAFVSPVAVAATLAAAIGAAATTGSRPAGMRAGVLAAVLGAPMHFAADLTGLLRVHHYALTDAYDIAAYPHSGYPDVASYLLSDAIAGELLTVLVLSPVVLGIVAFLGGVAGAAGAPRRLSKP